MVGGGGQVIRRGGRWLMVCFKAQGLREGRMKSGLRVTIGAKKHLSHLQFPPFERVVM